MGKILNVEYACIHGTYWMYYGVAYSFASAFLLARGYSNSEIGLVLAAGNVAAAFLQPFMADLADRSKKISLIGVTRFSTVLLMILTAGTFIMQKKSAALWIVYIMMLAWLVALQPLFNSLAFKLEESGFHINFGIARSMGSLAYAVLCAFLGSLVESKGILVLPVSGEIILLMLLISIVMVKRHFAKACGMSSSPAEISKAAEILDENGTSTGEEEINLIQFIKRNKLFMVVNIGVAGVFFSNAVTNNFMLQIVNGVGGDSADMGRIFSVMAFLEIPALFFFDNVHKKFSCQTLLKIASAAYVMKTLLIYLSGSVGMLYFAHLFQTFSFGLFLPAMVSYIDEIMAKGEAVKGQALYTVVVTVSSVFASIIGGIILDAGGPSTLLIVATAITATGALIIFLTIGKIKKA